VVTGGAATLSDAHAARKACLASPRRGIQDLQCEGCIRVCLPQVVKAIQRGEHAAAPLGTTIWWAHRLLSGRRLLGRTQQRALIRCLTLPESQ
jgi:hypothetical protein